VQEGGARDVGTPFSLAQATCEGAYSHSPSACMARKVPQLVTLPIQLLDGVSSVVTDLAAQLPLHSKVAEERSLLDACRKLNAAILTRKRLGGLVSISSSDMAAATEDSANLARLLGLLGRGSAPVTTTSGSSSSSGSSTPASGGGTAGNQGLSPNF